jgi:hypothetical protein
MLIFGKMLQLSLSVCIDHTTMKALFDVLRNCAPQRISSVIPHLANLYDNLLHRDFNQPEISVSICELLFLLEDLVDHGDCKISFLKFLFRNLPFFLFDIANTFSFWGRVDFTVQVRYWLGKPL